MVWCENCNVDVVADYNESDGFSCAPGVHERIPCSDFHQSRRKGFLCSRVHHPRYRHPHPAPVHSSCASALAERSLAAEGRVPLTETQPAVRVACDCK